MLRQPEFRPYALVRIGDMQLKMGMQGQAESTLFEALRLDPTADTGTLFKLAEDYDKAGRTSEALRLHDQIRQIKGASYEASYLNRLGNFYYSKAEYAVLIGEQAPDLLEAILKNPGGVSALTRVLRALLAEQVPVTAFRKIVEHYLELSQAGTGPLDIVESIRGLAGIVELLPGNQPAARRLSTASTFTGNGGARGECLRVAGVYLRRIQLQGWNAEDLLVRQRRRKVLDPHARIKSRIVGCHRCSDTQRGLHCPEAPAPAPPAPLVVPPAPGAPAP
jgi:tetratricopeptide (TPR) repeat protein